MACVCSRYSFAKTTCTLVLSSFDERVLPCKFCRMGSMMAKKRRTIFLSRSLQHGRVWCPMIDVDCLADHSTFVNLHRLIYSYAVIGSLVQNSLSTAYLVYFHILFTFSYQIVLLDCWYFRFLKDGVEPLQILTSAYQSGKLDPQPVQRSSTISYQSSSIPADDPVHPLQ